MQLYWMPGKTRKPHVIDAARTLVELVQQEVLYGVGAARIDPCGVGATGSPMALVQQGSTPVELVQQEAPWSWCSKDPCGAGATGSPMVLVLLSRKPKQDSSFRDCSATSRQQQPQQTTETTEEREDNRQPQQQTTERETTEEGEEDAGGNKKIMATGGSDSGLHDDLFTSVLHTFYNEQLTSAFVDYYKALKELCRLCYTDPDFSYVLSGSGFDGVPIPLKYFLTDKTLNISKGVQNHIAYHIHRHGLVLQDVSVEYKDKRPLLYYITQQQQHPGRVKLWMSGRTYTQMLRGSYGLEFDDRSAHVLKDSFTLPKFYLSAARYDECFREICSNFLCTYRPQICSFSLDTGLETTIRQQPDDRDGKYVGKGERGHIVYSIKNIPALFCPEWPEAARDWINRPRPSGWPTRPLVQRATQEGCLLVPDFHISEDEMEDWMELQKDRERFRDGNASYEDEDEASFIQGRECDWTYCFTEAERVLLESLNPLQRTVTSLIYAMLLSLDDFRKVFDSVHIKHTLLHLFEEAPTKSTADLSVMDLVLVFLDRFCDYLRKGQMPHYFIDDWNLLHTVAEEHVLDIEETLDDLRQSLKLGFYTCDYLPMNCVNRALSEYGTNLCDLLNNRLLHTYTQNLWGEFQENAHFVSLAGYVKLHKSTYEEALLLNREVKRTILRDYKDPPHHVNVYLSLLESHLGVLYQAKARASFLKRQKAYLHQEAETCYTASQTADGSLCRIRLANFYYHQGKYYEALQILDQVLANVHADPWVFDDLPDNDEKLGDASDDSIFYKQLWYQWNRSLLNFDVMVAKCVRSTLPTEMDRSASLSLCHVLGNAEHSAAVYSSSFTASLIMALCHIRLQEPGIAKGILQRLERDSDMEGQKDLNEKRTAAYMLILGNTYISMDQRDEAGHAYNLSLMTFPSPRNPARLCMMGMSYSRIWEQVVSGVKLVTVTAIVSLTLAYLQAQLY